MVKEIKNKALKNLLTKIDPSLEHLMLMKDSDNVVVEYAPYGEGNLANAEFVSVVNPPNSEESSENEESSESEEPVTP